MLRKAQGLLTIEKAREYIFHSNEKTLHKAWRLLLSGKFEGKEKVRKNRIKKCLELTDRLLVFSPPQSKAKQTLQLTTEFLGSQDNWKEGSDRSEPWHIAYTLLGHVYGDDRAKVIEKLLEKCEDNAL